MCGVRFVCWNVIQSFVFARKNSGSGARCARQCRSDVVPQRKNARLREVPAGFVQLEIKLNRGAFVETRATDSVTSIVAAWIGERRSRFWWKTVQT